MTSPLRDVYIVSASARTALGDLQQTWDGILNGRSGIREVNRFDTSQIDYNKAALVDAPRFERKGSLLCGLIESCIDSTACSRKSAEVFWAGVKSDVEYIEANAQTIKDEEMPRGPSDFRRLVTRQVGLQGGGLEINAACASSAVAMALAADRIAHGETDAVVVAAADIVSRFSFMGFSALRALSPSDCRPFDAERDGLCLGDGASLVILGDEKTAEQAPFEPLGRLTGWGVANDANHITGPARDGRGLVRAIHQALHQSATPPDKIAAMLAHGTGTVFNDAMELIAIQSVFGSRHFPVASVKGAIGHTLGAAGAIEAVLALKALNHRAMPPTTGMRRPESGAENYVHAKPQSFDKGPVLSTNSGFSGVNAALVLEEV